MARLRVLGVIGCVAAMLVVAAPADAQDIEADLTTHAINVETDFSGAKVALFGAVGGIAEDDDGTRPDIIIVVRGPQGTLNVRRKRRIAGLWINADGASFDNVPGYYTVLTNRPIAEIASFNTLGELRIGVSSVKTGLLLAAAGEARKNAGDYIEAIVRILGRNKLYQESDGGITFIGKYLFRAEFELPANVPLGSYEADVYLFRNTQLVSQYTTRLDIEKSGLEQWIYSLAHDQPLLYGILSVILAIAAGMAASAIFRKR
jgi:uncharacterized protein (TIGR02186 family)